MPIQYRKRIKIFPGVFLNIGKKSHSWSFGFKGAHTTYNPKTKKVTQSMDLPGGLSWRKQYSAHQTEQEKPTVQNQPTNIFSAISSIISGIFTIGWNLIKLVIGAFIVYEVIKFIIILL